MGNAEQIDLTVARSIGEILGATARIYGAYPALFAALALAVMAPFDLAVLAITGHGPLSSHQDAKYSLLSLLIRSSLITPLISALHMRAVATIGDGSRPRLAAVAAGGLAVLPVVAAAEIVAELGIGLGFVALIIPGIVLSLRWAVVAQAAALEHEGWLEALRSSARLTAEHYLHVFGLTALAAVLSNVGLLAARALPLGSSTGLASVALGIGVDTVIASFAALTFALLYFDLKARPRDSPRARHEYHHLRDLDS